MAAFHGEKWKEVCSLVGGGVEQWGKSRVVSSSCSGFLFLFCYWEAVQPGTNSLTSLSLCNSDDNGKPQSPALTVVNAATL